MDADVVRAVNDLTTRWARTLPAENTVVAGLGLWPLLAILATGCGRARTRRTRRGRRSRPGDRIDRARSELIEAIEASADLHAALGVWVSEQLKLANRSTV